MGLKQRVIGSTCFLLSFGDMWRQYHEAAGCGGVGGDGEGFEFLMGLN